MTLTFHGFATIGLSSRGSVQQLFLTCLVVFLITLSVIPAVLCGTKFHRLTMLHINYYVLSLWLCHPVLSSLPAFLIRPWTNVLCSPPHATKFYQILLYSFFSSSSIFQQRRPRLNCSSWYGEKYCEVLVSSFWKDIIGRSVITMTTWNWRIKTKVIEWHVFWFFSISVLIFHTWFALVNAIMHWADISRNHNSSKIILL